MAGPGRFPNGDATRPDQKLRMGARVDFDEVEAALFLPDQLKDQAAGAPPDREARKGEHGTALDDFRGLRKSDLPGNGHFPRPFCPGTG